MSTAPTVQRSPGELLEKVLIHGNLRDLKPDEKVVYYNHVCESLGLNPVTKPFEFMTLQGKEILYARREATEQLRKIYNVSLQIVSRETIDGVYVVTARAQMINGRVDESTGAVTIHGLKGDMLANAFMKAETKAKRRVTLSICGLGMLDESEAETIAGAKFDKPQSTETKKEVPGDTHGATTANKAIVVKSRETNTALIKPALHPKIIEGNKIKAIRTEVGITEDELMAMIHTMGLPADFRVMTIEQMQSVTQALEDHRAAISKQPIPPTEEEQPEWLAPENQGLG